MDAGKQKVLVRKSAATHKQQGKALVSVPKVAIKMATKRKNDAKDDRPTKKGTGPSVGDQ